MEVLQTAQCFELVAGLPRFSYTKVIHKCREELYSSSISQRIPSGSKAVDLEKLSNMTRIPIEAYWPRFTPEMTKAPTPLPPSCYVKRPNLIAYKPELGAAQSVLQDLHACEKLRKHPHSNIAIYYGCEVSDGRIVGLCFRTYRETLMERVNPGHLNKQQRGDCNIPAASRYLSMIRNGISHIHSLGFAHNDINPSNIMFDDNNTLVIIDFDSCLPFDSMLTTTKRTPGWHNPKVQTSDPQNDWDAVLEIEKWLHGSTEEYMFHHF